VAKENIGSGARRNGRMAKINGGGVALAKIGGNGNNGDKAATSASA